MTDEHPFHLLLPQHAASLRHRAFKLCANEHRAEDLVQTTLLKAWASRDSYHAETNLRAWLFTILRNTFFSELRKHRREVEDIDGAFARALFEEPRQEHVIALRELGEAIALLPASQRAPLLLMGAYGFSQLEAAAACGCTVGTIKSRVSRTRTVLSEMLDHVAFNTSPRIPPDRRIGQWPPDCRAHKANNVFGKVENDPSFAAFRSQPSA